MKVLDLLFDKLWDNCQEIVDWVSVNDNETEIVAIAHDSVRDIYIVVTATESSQSKIKTRIIGKRKTLDSAKEMYHKYVKSCGVIFQTLYAR